MKKRLLAILIVFISGYSNYTALAQGNDKKFFHSFGFSAFTDYANSPVILVTKLNTSVYSSSGLTASPTYTTYKLATWSLSYYTVTYQVRYNIYEMGNNMSLSLSIPFSLGLSGSMTSESYNGTSYSSSSTQGKSGFGSINVPLFLEINLGNGSTYSSDKDHGIVGGLGVEYVKNPIIGGGYIEDDNKVKIEVPSSWIQPVVEIGYRYWNRNNKAREINFKYGSGFSDSNVTALFPDDKITSSKTIKLTFLYMIGY